MKAVASRVTEKSDVLLLQAVDMDDSGPYEIAEPRAITALETYTPSCKLLLTLVMSMDRTDALKFRATNTPSEATCGDRISASYCSTRKA